jgi:hypothetical protein
MLRVIYILLLVFSIASTGAAQSVEGTLKNDSWDFISANRMLMWVANNGALSHNPLTLSSGLEWPKGSGHTLAYSEGLVVAGLVEGQVHVSGSTYTYGWQAGNILSDGTASDPSSPVHRIYRAHRFDATWWAAQTRTEQERLLRDFVEWPVTLGAPWSDENANGIYDPDTTAWLSGAPTDTPLLPGDEVLWFVSNDLDSRRTMNLYGSPPSGLEMHTIIWSSSGHPLLDNVIFREHTLINKGQDAILDMHVGSWEDVDLGDAFDDHCGVDTAIGMAYAYNALRADEMYGLPPATGLVWLQTPVIDAPGETARYGLGTRADQKNLPLSAFSFYIGGSSVYREPTLKQPIGAIHLFNNLKGRMWNGREYIDPTTSEFDIPLTLAGDPVLGTGWIDGIINAPGDRRFLSGSGSFMLAPGDTQKVLLARLAADGGNHLLSVRALRNDARQLRDIYRNLPMGASAPVFTSRLIHTSPAGFYEVRTTGGPFAAGTTAAAAVLRAPDGSELQRVAMFDDGAHDDGAAGDGVYGMTFSGFGKSTGADLFIVSTDPAGEKEWFVESELALPGQALATFTELLLDTPKSDGKAQPGEYLRLRLRIHNGTTQEMGPWHLFFRDAPSLAVQRAVKREGTVLAAGGTLESAYDPNDQDSYIGINLPVDTPPGIHVLPVTLMSAQHCVWQQDLIFSVDTLPAATPHGLLTHVQGKASGTLGYTITMPSALTDHDYRVSIEGEDFDTKTMHVEDVTLGTTLHRGIAVPNRFEPYSPAIDGWQINIGTAFDEPVYDPGMMRLESFTNDANGIFSEPARPWFTVYEDDILSADEGFFGSTLTQYDIVPVRLVFDRTSGQRAYNYHRGTVPNYSFQGMFDIPVRAYDMSDSAHPRQITLGFVEQVNRPHCDNRYMPTTDVNDREILLVFEDDYHSEPDPKFLEPLQTVHTSTHPTYYTVWAMRDTTQPLFEDGDAYTITPRVPVSNRDVYILSKPRTLGVESTPARPSAIALHPNYPNPFGSDGAGTTIAFDTHRDGRARLTVHDALGRRVATALDQELRAGSHRFVFDGAGLRAGVYILSLEHGGERRSRTITITR